MSVAPFYNDKGKELKVKKQQLKKPFAGVSTKEISPAQMIHEETSAALNSAQMKPKEFASTPFYLPSDAPDGRPLPRITTNCTDRARAKKP